MELTLVNKKVLICTKGDKSTLIRQLVMEQQQDFDKIYIITANKFYGYIDKTIFITPKKTKKPWVKTLIALINEQKFLSESGHLRKVLLIIDDTNISYFFSVSIKTIFDIGRSLEISLIITSKALFHLPLNFRLHFDYIAVSELDNWELILLADDYLRRNIKEDDFLSLYYKHTLNGLFLINNAGKNLVDSCGTLKI